MSGDDYVISAELAERLLDGGCLKGRGWGTNDPLFRLEISLSSQRKLRQRIIPERGMFVRRKSDGATFVVALQQPAGITQTRTKILVGLTGRETGMTAYAPGSFRGDYWAVIDGPSATNNNQGEEQ